MNGTKYTAEMKINPDVAKAFTVLGEACRQTAEALLKFFQAAADCMVAMAQGVDIAQLLKAAKVQAALKEAPPRVRHLAEHGKKYRTRKKNINRALKDYERGLKRDRTRKTTNRHQEAAQQLPGFEGRAPATPPGA